LTRQDFYYQGVIFALLPFIHPEHYAASYCRRDR
jgi:non-canonical (house-cleaning) NTP pyrophosphatase